MWRFEVEFDFVDTKWGRRPMQMRGFEKREDAEAFAATQPDGNVVEYVEAYKFSETGKKIRLW